MENQPNKICVYAYECRYVLIYQEISFRMFSLASTLSFSLLFGHSVVSSSLQCHGLQHARLPCPSSSPRLCSNSRPLSQWCHPTISSSVSPFSSCPQSSPASGSFPMSRLFTSGGKSIGVSASASVLPVNIQDWFPLGLTGLLALLFKGLSGVFSSTTVQKHQFSLQSANKTLLFFLQFTSHLIQLNKSPMMSQELALFH